MNDSRRDFVKKMAFGSSSITIGGIIPGVSAKSYSNIIGSNERINVGIMGTNGRGRGMARNFSTRDNCNIVYICDVEDRALSKGLKAVEQASGYLPKAEKDIRIVLEDDDVDAMYLAPPDHWHTPATILSCRAGKHVYVEKPLSHNPNEGELAIKAARKYDRIVQMGNQRRSWENLQRGIEELRNGIIGEIYLVKTWYTNSRSSIGIGELVEAPSGFDFDLWQGPAPRKPFRDNLIHYNWHWFWHWGTGEALNNGTHEIDVARWGLGIDFPLKISSIGGRYHFNDDWETPDTQMISYDCGNGVLVTWEGRSCNGLYVEGEDRGIIFYGSEGSLRIKGNDYIISDLKGDIVKEVKSNIIIDGRNNLSPSAELDNVHIDNFLDSIRKGVIPNSDVAEGHKSTLWAQLGNISQRVGRTLNINQESGHIINDTEAMSFWSREYEPGWELHV